MQHIKPCKRCGMGRLPAKAPLAYPFVPFQPVDSQKYEPRKALVRGTLYQGLDLPFKGMVNKQEKPVTPLTELQTLSFVIQELTLYLDTHREDKTALAHLRDFQKRYAIAKEQYECKFGPLTHQAIASEEYQWLDDPWPWEYAKNRGV